MTATPNVPCPLNAQEYSKRPGATPNETTSDKESYSRPKWLVLFVIRADFPSNTSKIIATKMAIAAAM